MISGGDIKGDAPSFYDELLEQRCFPLLYANAANACADHNAINATNTRKYSRQDSSKWRALLQILDQIVHVVQVSRQQVLLLFRGSRGITLTIGTLSTSTSIGTVVERSSELTRTTLQHGGDGDGAVCRGDGGRFGHEVEVQELDELKLHLSACFAGLEQAGNCQETI